MEIVKKAIKANKTPLAKGRKKGGKLRSKANVKPHITETDENQQQSCYNSPRLNALSLPRPHHLIMPTPKESSALSCISPNGMLKFIHCVRKCATNIHRQHNFMTQQMGL
eukprot:4289496-Ditylum_brightwellii.AAC.1